MIRLSKGTKQTPALINLLRRLGWRFRWVNGHGVTLERVDK